MGRRRDGDGIDVFVEQFIDFRERAAAGKRGGPRAVFRQRIDDTDQRHARQTGQDPGMVAAHDAGADHADTKEMFRVRFHVQPAPKEPMSSTPFSRLRPPAARFRSTCPLMWRIVGEALQTHFDSNNYTTKLR